MSAPEQVDFEQSARAWLFDLAPARWRYEESLHRYPAELAALVKELIKAHIFVAKKHHHLVTNRAKEELGDWDAAQEVLDVCLREKRWAETLLRQVGAIEKELRGSHGSGIGRRRNP
ncbi:hypothetical protein [Streptomyces chartreusis]|uniref:hypothetical protein n=1 Tax=Streptomyces chartreusis TaxID=1969 RepID=UPI0037F17719